ncbi:MAG: BatA domain-containing protein, partial [Chloroflexota bacterium]
MTFLAPTMLYLLLVIPILLLAYILAQRRRQKYALRYASLSLVKEAMGRGPGIRRHIPPMLFIIGLTAMIVALSRPFAYI